VSTLQDDAKQAKGNVSAERGRLEARLVAIQGQMDRAYCDKLDGKIPEDF